jgi:hypothetical protein
VRTDKVRVRRSFHKTKFETGLRIIENKNWKINSERGRAVATTRIIYSKKK